LQKKLKGVYGLDAVFAPGTNHSYMQSYDMSYLLNTSIEPSSMPDFFTFAIQSRDHALLEKEREIYMMRAIIEEQQKIINVYRGIASPTEEPPVEVVAAVEESYVPEFAPMEEVPTAESVEVEKKHRHRNLKNYLINGDRIVHTLKDSEWCVYYDAPDNELVGTGGVYKSLRNFVLAHRAEKNRTIKNMLPWNECKVLRNGTYIKMSELEPIQ
jgi:hypothetical protein